MNALDAPFVVGEKTLPCHMVVKMFLDMLRCRHDFWLNSFMSLAELIPTSSWQIYQQQVLRKTSPALPNYSEMRFPTLNHRNSPCETAGLEQLRVRGILEPPGVNDESSQCLLFILLDVDVVLLPQLEVVVVALLLSKDEIKSQS